MIRYIVCNIWILWCLLSLLLWINNYWILEMLHNSLKRICSPWGKISTYYSKLLVILFKFSVSLLVVFFLTSWGVFCFMVHFFTLFSVLLEFHTLRKPFCQHCSNTSTTPYLQSLFPYPAFFLVVFISIGYYILYLYVHCLLY